MTYDDLRMLQRFVTEALDYARAHPHEPLAGWQMLVTALDHEADKVALNEATGLDE